MSTMSTSTQQNRGKLYQNGMLLKPNNGDNTNQQTETHRDRTLNFQYHERRYTDPLDQQHPWFYTTHSLVALMLITAPIIYFGVIDPINIRFIDESSTYDILL